MITTSKNGLILSIAQTHCFGSVASQALVRRPSYRFDVPRSPQIRKGKTILASVVIDELRCLPDTTVVFFYCKHDEETRNTFMAVARSILWQLSSQNPLLLPYIHEHASSRGEMLLTSKFLAKEILKTALSSCERTFIVIDGLDECPRAERVEITSFFRGLVESTPVGEMEPVRCLFVSQDDGVALESFRGIPRIKIADHNNQDLRDYAQVWHKKLEAKFGSLQGNCHIANIITARAQGVRSFRVTHQLSWDY